MAKRKKKRTKPPRSRFKKAADAQAQLAQVERAQKEVRQGKLRLRIDSIEKSRQRFRNSLRSISNADDAFEQFE